MSISSASINDDGQLVISFSDGMSVNLDKVVGMNGTDGISVIKSEINDNGELVLTYSNNQVANLGVVIGANGKDGIDGKDGAPGRDGVDGKDGAVIEKGTDGLVIVAIIIGCIAIAGEIAFLVYAIIKKRKSGK